MNSEPNAPPDDDPNMPLFEENDGAVVAASTRLQPAPEAQGLLRGLNPEQLAAVTLPARQA